MLLTGTKLARRRRALPEANSTRLLYDGTNDWVWG
jgi:hypothetical protein